MNVNHLVSHCINQIVFKEAQKEVPRNTFKIKDDNIFIYFLVKGETLEVKVGVEEDITKALRLFIKEHEDKLEDSLELIN